MKDHDVRESTLYLWILSFLSNQKRKVFLFIVCGTLATTIEMLFPKVLQLFIDDVLPKQNVRDLIELLGILVLLTGIMFGLNAWRNILQRIVSENGSKSLQLAIFNQLRLLGFSYHEKTPVGTTLSLFQVDVANVQRVYGLYIPKMVKELLLLLVATIFMFTIHWKISLLAMSFSLLYYVIGPFFERKAVSSGVELRIQQTQFTQKLHNSLSGIAELRTYGAEEWNMGKMNAGLATMNRARYRYSFFAGIRSALKFISINMGLLILFIFGIWAVKNGSILVGEFVALSFYCFRVMNELTSVVKLYTEQKILMNQARNLYEFMNIKPDVMDHGTAKLSKLHGDIELMNVSFGYDKDHLIIKDLSFQVQSGQRVALVGTSGNGKSTILKLIARFYDVTQGLIKIDGYDIKDIPLPLLRNQVGIVFQETYLFGGTIRENILFGRTDATESEVYAAAHAAYAHEFIEALPNGYETTIGERGVKLSGGQKQRIAIARLFLKNPSILLLDEATSALDNTSEREVQRAFEELLQGRTTITVAHRLTTVQNVDNILLIEHGKVIGEGSYEELLVHSPTFKRLVTGVSK
ncbi:ABC transporter ATP-binding protein [Paenibacillus sp. Marseille-Q7038]